MQAVRVCSVTAPSILTTLFFKTGKILEEVNLNAKSFRVPKWWFYASIKVIAPVLLIIFFGWNMSTLIGINKGVYGFADGYSMTANVILGWCVSAAVILFGIVFSIYEAVKFKDGRYDPVPWDKCGEAEEVAKAVEIAETAEDTQNKEEV